MTIVRRYIHFGGRQCGTAPQLTAGDLLTIFVAVVTPPVVHEIIQGWRGYISIRWN